MDSNPPRRLTENKKEVKRNMPECFECGEDIKLTTWNAWNLFFLCGECENKFREEARCPYCKGDFLHLRASEFGKHLEICRKTKRSELE